MEKAKKLTPKQSLFVKEYLVDLNAKQAAIRAGYSKKTAEVIGHENLSKPYLAAIIQEEMDKRSKRVEITADNVLNELAKLAFGNIKNLYDENGSLAHPQDLDDAVSATITEVTEKQVGSQEESVVLERKYKVADKKGSLELLGRHLKLFTDKIEHTGKDGEAIEFTDTARAARAAAIFERGRQERARQADKS